MQSHAAIERIDRERQRQPGLDQMRHVGIGGWKSNTAPGTLLQLRIDRQAGHVRGFERIDHVKIVRPGLGKILPRVRTCIRRDKTLGPVGGSALRVILLERGHIVPPLVAEDAAEFIEMRRVGDQPVPIIMPDLVAEMAEQRAIGLAHLIAAALALCVVGFGQIDRDDAVGMAGHDPANRSGSTSARNSKRQTGGVLGLASRAAGETETACRTSGASPLRAPATCRDFPAATGRGSSGCGGTPRSRCPAPPPARASCTRRKWRWRNSDRDSCRRAPATRVCSAAPALSSRLQRGDRLPIRQITERRARSVRSAYFRNRAAGRNSGTERASCRLRFMSFTPGR